MPDLPAMRDDVQEPLERLWDQIQDMLDRWRPGRRQRGADDEQRDMEGRALTRMTFRGPALDVKETDDKVIVNAEMPGLKPEDFSVEVTADRLILRGEKKEEREERDQRFHRIERRMGSFARVVNLPWEVDPDKTEATYHDGVLHVEMPKTEASRTRSVKVRVH